MRQLQKFPPIASSLLTKVLLSLIVGLSFTQNAFAQSTQALAEIEKAYAASNYAQAESLIDEQIKDYDVSPVLHYLKGNVYAAQGNISIAAAEYEQALRLSPSPLIRAYCEKGLAETGVTTTVSPSGMHALEKQTGREVNRSYNQTLSAAHQTYKEGKEYQQNHSEKTAAIVGQMEAAGSYNGRGHWTPAYDSADIDAVAARRKAKEARVVEQAHQMSQDIRGAGQERSTGAIHSVKGLSSQVVFPVKSGGAVFDSSSSNLYVRNYSQPLFVEPESIPKPASVILP